MRIELAGIMTNKFKLIGFLVLLALFVAGVAGHNFMRYYIAKDYPLHVFTACDPSIHDCFKANSATADLSFQTGMYEKVMISAAGVPICLGEHSCTNFSCKGVTGLCEITYCSSDSKEEGETCSTESQ